MRGIILAAGRGTRINGGARQDPKCLLKIGGVTLMDRQLGSLRASGIDEITVVVGYEADRVREACGPTIHFMENERYDQTNSLYSLWLAKDFLLEGFVVMNSDVLFHHQLLTDLLTAQYEDALLIAYCDETMPPFGDEEMKVKVRSGRVVEVAKAMSPHDADGENVGIVKFGPAGAKLLVECLDALITRGSDRAWAPRAFNDFAARRGLHAIGTRGYPWIEIDFPEDYDRAVNEILPKIMLIEESLTRAPLKVMPLLTSNHY